MATTIKHRQGDTMSYTGLVELPVGTWTAQASLTRNGQAVTGTTVRASLVSAGGNDWTLRVYAHASDTDLWPANPKAEVVYQIAVKFKDASSPPNEITAEPFNVKLTSKLVNDA